ncbi:MAG: Integral membrane protein [Promethearchaeota archaeon]|nr:MAG: Integral membrane protein [Candidatus Lokiarchaeota archaeon]
MIVLDTEDLKNAKISLWLLIINLACFVIFQSPIGEQYSAYLVQNNQKIIDNLEWWRLFTAIFLHADVMHIFSNIFALFLFGALVEKEFTKLTYIIIYFVSGLLGNFFTLILFPPNTISLGASGAIFGLIGSAFVIIAMDNPQLLLFALVYIAFFLISSLAPGINIWAHLFGLVNGVVMGYYVKQKKRSEYESEYARY